MLGFVQLSFNYLFVCVNLDSYDVVFLMINVLLSSQVYVLPLCCSTIGLNFCASRLHYF